ncbi:hypothetical protein [Streptomyces carpaticus]|uniref:DUF2742 domain-containing protein n=1 Tax=Streptomyces carpaticus TaxID=285558 RepID=A0ABV4ZGU8_9ACTN
MTVKKIWAVDHQCGHQAEHDLSGRPADRRAGFARWLADRECTDCWRADRTDDAEAKAAWRDKQRAAEQAEADEWTRRYGMPPLEGSERAVPWAVRCRHQLLAAAYTALVVEGDTDEADWAEVEEAARTITRAGWWIDQREAEPGDLPELLVAATDDDRPTENPFL